MAKVEWASSDTHLSFLFDRLRPFSPGGCPLLGLEVDEQIAHIRGRHAAQPARLADCGRAHLGQLFAALLGQGANCGVIDVIGDFFGVLGRHRRQLLLLALNEPTILELDLDRLFLRLRQATGVSVTL